MAKPAETPDKHRNAAVGFIAPPTIEKTLGLCRRIKAVAFRRDVAVSNTLRELLGRRFPNIEGEAP